MTPNISHAVYRTEDNHYIPRSVKWVRRTVGLGEMLCENTVKIGEVIKKIDYL